MFVVLVLRPPSFSPVCVPERGTEEGHGHGHAHGAQPVGVAVAVAAPPVPRTREELWERSTRVRVDLPPGECQGMLTTREGFALVCQELLTNQPALGAMAGIAGQEMTDLETTNARIDRLDAFLPALRKAVEVLTETRYKLDDQRQRIALDAAKSIDRRANRYPELVAKYQRTREYRSEIAKKALKTKEKNAAEHAAGTPAQPGAPPTQ